MHSEEIDWRIKVFDSLSLPAIILKPDRMILSANRNFLKKYGVSAGEIVGRSCHDFFYQSKEACPFETCPLPEVLTELKGHSILRKVITSEGEEKWEDRVFSPILDDRGVVQYIIESIRDVTQVKSLEKELSGIREFAAKLVQSSNSGIVAADRSGKILIMNEAAEQLTGYSLREAQSMTVNDLYPPGMAKEIMKKLRAEEHGGKGKLPCTRINFINARGEEIPVELTAAIIYEGGEEIATMGVFNDLRPKLADEERMARMLARIAHSEKMASLGQLAAGVAHEINNPLTGILLYANILMEAMASDDPRKQDLKNVIEDAQRCAEIVKNLLTYSRRAGSQAEVLHINTLVEYSLNLIRDQKLFMNVDIRKDLSDEMMLVKADKNQMTQVIINLVMNALDAMDKKGILTFKTYRDKKAQKICLEVSDTGCGILIENLSRIFDPFFTTKEPGKGTGLGLSTVYGIVKDNEGQISVKETSEKGTTFLVELPAFQLQQALNEEAVRGFERPAGSLLQ
ncbi:MAG: PAS domain S-box protein [Desulforhabdus sp.]|nr:PAS domain S-box protein [Desulforhabdus sp.]